MSAGLLRPTSSTETTTMNQSMGYIFCDGACSGNGTARAVAGWAWAYWPGHVTGSPARHGSGRVVGAATNQRAELMALLEALRAWSTANGGPVVVMTDSMYAINCTSKWGPAWARKGWSRDSGEPLQNLDLIKPLVALWRSAWRLEHVRGHQTNGGWQAHGNNWVDRAAVAAAATELTTRAAAGGAASRPVVFQQEVQQTPSVILPPITDTPVFDPDEFLAAAATIEVTEPVADVIEHVPAAAPAKVPAKARRVPGMTQRVFQTDISTWFQSES
jgi:ribonuclease HI